jgi:hypothetical protein
MIGFSIEFKRWYFVIRGPKGRVYLATGFAKRMPVITLTGAYMLDQLRSRFMIGFSIEFKRWYFVIRGPKGRVYWHMAW